MTSQAFGYSRSRTALIRPGGGLRGEVYKLRADIEDAFRFLETLIGVTGTNGLASTLFVDGSTEVTAGLQDGSILTPFATVQAALNFIAGSSYTSWHVCVAFGNYSGEPALVVPDGKDVVLEGVIRRGAMTLPAVSWSVTGNLTSRLGFRNIIVGKVTVIDGATPATNAVLTYENCSIGGVETTGTSFLTLVPTGTSLASFSEAVSPVVSCAVAGDILVWQGVMFANNVQFRAPTTLVRCGEIHASGCTFNTDIEVTGTVAEFEGCHWDTPGNADVIFTGAAGTLTFDGESVYDWGLANGSVINGSVGIKSQALPSSMIYVDGTTAVPLAAQDGSAARPHATIQAAVDRIAASATMSWTVSVSMGDYSAESVTLPEGRGILFDGPVNGATSLGSFTWPATGNNTSVMFFRNVLVGAVAITDGTSPAVLASIIFENCVCSGVSVTGTSDITMASVGISNAIIPVPTTTIASVVVGNIDGVGNYFVNNTFFAPSCTQVTCDLVVAHGAQFSQDIDQGGTNIYLTDCRWSSAAAITFTGAAGVVHFDSEGKDSFLSAGGSVVNGSFAELTLRGPLVLRSGVAIHPALQSAFGSTSTYNTFVIGSTEDGDPFGGGGGNGGLYAIARAGANGVAPTNEPFTALSGWDFGNTGVGPDQGRVLYFGGGGWDCPDCNAVQFYTTDVYNEVHDQAVRRLSMANSLLSIEATRLAETGVISPAAISGTLNNYNGSGVQLITGACQHVRLNPSAPAVITGIQGGVAGRVLTLHNISTNIINTTTFNHLDGGSSAANQLALAGLTSLVVQAGGTLKIWYDGLSNLWRPA